MDTHRPEAHTQEERGFRRRLTSYGDKDFALFLRKAFIKGAGYSSDALDCPIVGIIDTGSGYNPCHGNVPQLVEAIKRGVMLEGALPVAFPTISLHESFAHPTSMWLRNLMSMDTEEMLKAQPMDAVVLIGGCDKTVPAQLMGALSANIPSVQLVTGSMLTGSHGGRRVGACSDCRAYWARYRAGEVDEVEIEEVNSQLVGSVGTCSVMGTASTMACVAEALGMATLGSASPPAPTAARMRVAERAGRLAATVLLKDGMKPKDILRKKNFENAMRVLLAIGGSTNGVIHLTAIAGRMGIKLDLRDFDKLGETTPVLVDLKPSGMNYMEDFHRAGGVPRVLQELRDRIHMDALTITGRTLGQELAAYHGLDFEQTIIRSVSSPIYPTGGLVPLFGTLAPKGALIKVSAASPSLLERRARAVVFTSAADMAARIDSPKLDVSESDILVLQNIGPIGGPGMPEAGLLPIPKKLARKGIKDMLRISDGRMSGTAGGSIVLHVSPEAALGGPLAFVRTGDEIEISVIKRRLDLCLDQKEMSARKAEWDETHGGELDAKRGRRGYEGLYMREVTGAEDGCDFRFLSGE
ncbi:dihydroxy-acid dehydratase [Gloeophyllum trabeum ATCC 11539]|uniref:Dihydroxy-acid dehydratase n=1 Tax=Gloeophyllum trabeum (strain ATCC 11539 / FP-39264 / Madison 617) TaxID=670483 RepID=S7QAU2_GLOTA|nr:dihydroxy-acid dehydratase [Gloeophyllum trabeum ATCC 11539]EPQ57006.1 dihydroxy-acid dehydratase [Gloeophyllum trabeum ATCC 11539]